MLRWCRNKLSLLLEYSLFPAKCFLMNPTWSLRRQVKTSFGLLAIFGVTSVLVFAITTTIFAGKSVQDHARQIMRDQVLISIRQSSHMAAKTLSEEFDSLRGTSAILVELVRDRIVGYPYEEWEDDVHVPFPVYTQDGSPKKNQYPLKSPLLPRDWNITSNLNSENLMEHLQERAKWITDRGGETLTAQQQQEHLSMLASTSSVFSFQGNCDPDVYNPTDPAYYPGCSPAHNDAATGGVVFPTTTAAGLEQKAADIGVFLKPLWESRSDTITVGVHFENSAAGATVHYPAFVHRNARHAYRSIGCDWMHLHNNPLTGKPFATQEQTAKCHPAGTMVSRREFNPMELAWCRDQALHPNQTLFVGPVLDPLDPTGSMGLTSDETQIWSLLSGRAIFDRRTKEFIGCSSLATSLHQWSSFVNKKLAAHKISKAALIRVSDGMVVAGGDWDHEASSEPVHVTQTDVIPDMVSYHHIMMELAMVQGKEVEGHKHHHRRNRRRRRLEDSEHQHHGHHQDDHQEPSGHEGGHEAQNGGHHTTPEEQEEEHSHHQDHHAHHAGHQQGHGEEEENLMNVTSVTTAIHECSHISGLVLSISLIPETDFAIVQSVWEESFESIADIHDAIRDDVFNTVLLTVVIGVAGLALALSLITFVSMVLTRPLDWMQGVARQIVNHNNHSSLNLVAAAEADEGGAEWTFNVGNCTPRSEITELVQEFQAVLGGFSGKGTSSRVANKPIREIRNAVTWQSEFQQLYSHPVVVGGSSSVCDGTASIEGGVMNEVDVDDYQHQAGLAGATQYVPFTYPYLEKQMKMARSDASTTSTSSESDEITVLPPEFPDNSGTRKNRGRNLSNRPPSCCKKQLEDSKAKMVPASRSKLFRWILILIVMPLLATNLIIVTLVSWKVSLALSPLVESAVNASFDIAVDDLEVEAKLAAAHTEAMLSSPIRDLFLWSRISSWLYFGAIERSDGFVKMVSGAEQCKAYPDDGETCPWYDDKVNNAPCDCNWQSAASHECQSYEEDMRSLQKLSYTAQLFDADPVTGSRTTTSYPSHSTSAETTAWYEDVTKVPGAWKGASAEGVNTTYDRLRVSSAASVIAFPMYNALSSLVDQSGHVHFGTSVSFDADGMSVGWSGCSMLSPRASHFNNSAKVAGLHIDDTMCPDGKYGYDPRCWEWYQRGKKESEAHHTLFISPPYHSPTLKSLVSSWTQAILDPRTKEQVAQISMDWRLNDLYSFCGRDASSSMAFLVSPTSDASGGDTVAGPNFTPGNQSAPIAEVVLPDDLDDSYRLKKFNDLVVKMKDEQSGGCTFIRSKRDNDSADDEDGGADGSNNETFHIWYEPIRVRAVEPCFTDDYTRGVNASNFMVYSIGVAKSERELKEPSKEMEEQFNKKLENLLIAYGCCVVAVSLVVCLIAGQISLALSKPMLILLGVVRSINGGRIDDDIPPMEGGSREVNRVYSTFAKLFKIVRVSNSAFFSGNLSVAYSYVADALRLYKKIGDDKALAIASNNLGNILLAVYSDQQAGKVCACSQTNTVCAVKEALGLYDAAIAGGVRDMERSGLKIEFSQQLANRYFNRGLFYLHSAGHSCAPKNAVELGRYDLRRASELDSHMREYLVEKDLVIVNSGLLFDHWLRRLHGLASLWDIDERRHLEEAWDEAMLVHDCQQLLLAEWQESRGNLYCELDRIGRLQQLESAVIRLDLQRNNSLEAARLAMRMLAEDEFITEESFLYAAKALLEFMKKQDLSANYWSELTRKAVQRDLASMVASCKHTALASKKRCLVFCVQLADRSPATLTRLCDCLLSFLDSVFRCGDIVECVAGRAGPSSMTADGNERRGRNQRAALEAAILALATRQDGVHEENPAGAISGAIESIASSPECSDLEAHIVYVTDKSNELAAVERAIVEWKEEREAPCHIHWLELSTEWDDNENIASNRYRSGVDCTHVTTSLTRLVSALEQVSNSISLCVSLGNEGEILSGLTMERF